jgi:hypothetical protein
VLAAAVLAAVLVWRAAPGGTVAEITLDGEVVRQIDLSRVTEADTFTVEGPAGTNTIQVEPGRIRVEQADCPDQICVHQGWIDDGVVPIVCLPNRLVITLKTAAADQFDGLSQ